VVEQDRIDGSDPSERARSVGWVSTDPSVMSESETPSADGVPLHCPRNVQGVTVELAPLIGKVGIQKARRGEVVDALTLGANYVRRSYVEVFQKK
jgi:hypothetical protein